MLPGRVIYKTRSLRHCSAASIDLPDWSHLVTQALHAIKISTWLHIQKQKSTDSVVRVRLAGISERYKM